MQVLVNAIDKATKAGVYNLEEIALVMQSLEGLGKIAATHVEKQKALKDAQDKIDKKPLKATEKKADDKS